MTIHDIVMEVLEEEGKRIYQSPEYDEHILQIIQELCAALDILRKRQGVHTLKVITREKTGVIEIVYVVPLELIFRSSVPDPLADVISKVSGIRFQRGPEEDLLQITFTVPWAWEDEGIDRIYNSHNLD